MRELEKEIHKAINSDSPIDGTSISLEEGASGFECLTIHKAQGRGYNIVYVLPVDDGLWEWPFSQKKRLVNVAASRAKDELRIIASIEMMSKKVRRQLADAHQITVSANNTSTAKNNDELYFQKLIDYVADSWPNLLKHEDSHDFGFIKSNVVSIFDEVPKYRSENNQKRKGLEGMSAPAKCVDAHLEKMLRNGKLNKEREVLLKTLGMEGIPTHKDSGNEKSNSFDFALFLSQSDEQNKLEKLLLAIEVDGDQHESGLYKGQKINTPTNDKIKNEIVEKNGGKVLCWPIREQDIDHSKKFHLLRLADDGTSYCEIDDLLLGHPSPEHNYLTLDKFIGILLNP